MDQSDSCIYQTTLNRSYNYHHGGAHPKRNKKEGLFSQYKLWEESHRLLPGKEPKQITQFLSIPQGVFIDPLGSPGGQKKGCFYEKNY